MINLKKRLDDINRKFYIKMIKINKEHVRFYYLLYVLYSILILAMIALFERDCQKGNFLCICPAFCSVIFTISVLSFRRQIINCKNEIEHYTSLYIESRLMK